MASVPPTAGGGGLPALPALPADLPAGASDYRVYDAIVSGKSDDEIDTLIEDIAQGDEEKRDAAINPSFETPLQAALRLKRERLVCRLLAGGADVKQIYNGEATALAVCCMLGQPDCVRELLAKGHDPKETTRSFWASPGAAREEGATAAHVCADSGFEDERRSQVPQLDCLKALVQAGADINARDRNGATPLVWLAAWQNHAEARKSVQAFVALGADLESRCDRFDRTPIFTCGGTDLLLAFLEAGASPDVVDSNGKTPIMAAAQMDRGEARRGVLEELLRRSSPKTLRAVNHNGNSAADLLVPQEPEGDAAVTAALLEPWELRAIDALLRVGAPLKPDNARRVMRSAAAHGERQVAELAARKSPERRWMAHDDIVQLAFDFADVRAADQGLEVSRERLLVVAEQLAERVDELEEENEDLANDKASLESRVAELEKELARARGDGGSGGEEETTVEAAAQDDEDEDEEDGDKEEEEEGHSPSTLTALLNAGASWDAGEEEEKGESGDVEGGSGPGPLDDE